MSYKDCQISEQISNMDNLKQIVRNKSFDNVLWSTLLAHWGHNVRIAVYGNPDDPVDVCLECEDCDEVILGTYGGVRGRLAD